MSEETRKRRDETWKAITEEMRDESTAVRFVRDVMIESLHATQEELRKLADRIDEAVNREVMKWAKANGELAMLLDPEKIPAGNAAMLREALESICARASIGGEFDPQAYLDEIHEIAQAALSAPARNCDLFGGDYKMLHTAWFDWAGSPSGMNANGTAKLTFGKWLLAPANKKGGEA